MTDDRALVFQNIRQALAKRSESQRAAMPDWRDETVVCRVPGTFESLAEHFRFKFQAAGGIVITGHGELAKFIEGRGLKHGYADPALGLEMAGVELERVLDRTRVDDYEFGITRGTAAVAETGSLLITERDTSSRLAALVPWVHIVVLETSQIVPDMPSALRLLGDDRAALFVTGPSKTADVEGILIQGVHGPGVQVCCLV